MDKTGEMRNTKRIKTVLVGAAALVALVCAVVVITQLFGSSKAENSSIIVYRKNNESIVRIGSYEMTLPDSRAADFKCDSEKNRVFYTVESSYADGLYDLYYVELRRSELTEPKIIDYGIEKNYALVSGKVYYLKENEDAGANDGCVCDIDKNKIETYSTNVENFFPLDGSDVVYFIKMHGEKRVLYKYASASPIEVCREIERINYYNNCDIPHIIYEKKSVVNTGMTELYIAYSEGAPELICDNTYAVSYDEYSPNGNLYYFTLSGENISWSYVIADQYEESDKTVTKPKRTDFFSFFGISTQYNEALREYQDKLVRDEIRAALNESMEKGDFSAPVFTAFAYNENGNFKIAEKVDPANVISVSAHGEPKMIFEATEVVPSSTDMGALVDIAQRSDMAEVIEYARSVVESSVTAQGMEFAAYGSEGSVSYEFKGYDKSKTTFSFSENGGRIFALVRDIQGERLSLYTNSLDEKLMPSAEKNIDTGISSYRFIGDSVLYMKADIGKNTGDVYAYDGESNQKLSNAANAFTVEKSDDIIIIKNHNSLASSPTADYYIYSDGEEELVGEKIVVDSFMSTEKGKAAYISNADDGGSLYVYSKGKSACVSGGVSEILFFE